MTKTHVLIIAAIILVSVLLASIILKYQQLSWESLIPTMGNTVSGYVIGGGDTSPDGLFEARRVFVYEIRRDDGSMAKVTYTAYPPSPVGDKLREKIRHDFHAGKVLVGDYLKAHGSYDENTNTLLVAKEGDYIKTYPSKP